jgi:hypothetical protein
MLKKLIWPVLLIGGLLLSPAFLPFSTTPLHQAEALTIPYVEYGTWSPTAGGTSTYTTQIGTYAKIGKQVTAHCRITINAIGTGSSANISGLPYPVDLTPASYAIAPVYFTGMSQSVSSVVGVAGVQGASIVTMYSTLTDGVSMATNAVLTSGTTILFTVTYLTD